MSRLKVYCRSVGFIILLSIQMASAQSAKNVILMISDGQGFNTITATDYYTGTPAVYSSFNVKFGVRTNSANTPEYDPVGMAGSFTYAKGGYTDSAAAATAMFSGVKVNDDRINVANDGTPLQTFFEQAAWAGRSIGAISSVELSHATPAAVYSHNYNRDYYEEIANEGIYGSNPNSHNAFYDAGNYNGNFKVLMGAGHPDYTNNNTYDPSVSDAYIGGMATWADITDGSTPNGWTLVEDKLDFQNLMTGPTPDKVLGLAKVNQTLQNYRSGASSTDPPYDDPLNSNVPTLVEMTRAGLNILDNDTDGFALMIEGGAVDWANHNNRLGRMIEEQIDFNNAVQAVVDWVNASSNWNETLLIVTADHETGHLWGNGTAGTYFDVNTNGIYDAGVDYPHVGDNGVGNLPGAGYFSGNHTNALVPLFALGAGSELLASYVIGTDDNLSGYYNLDSAWTGAYIDNISIYNVMMEASNVPEPLTRVFLSLGGLLLRRCCKR
ncbi:MAG: alkaline phosphatase [Sedimentisphaerales bacterium]|nr:alkaline phosphatase [Sedimentisphaerales bacterium]